MIDATATEEWIELGVRPPKEALPECQVRLTKPSNKPARAHIVLRAAAAEWLHGSKSKSLRVSLGGDQLNKLRLTIDPAGKYRAGLFKGVYKIVLGHVDLWPDEHRDPTQATYRLNNGELFIALPEDFAKATPRQKPAPAPVAKASAAAASPAIPISTRAEGLAAAARVIDRRRQGVVSMGDPPPGRSALDQRRSQS